MSFKINNIQLQRSRTQTFEIVNSFPYFNNNDICTVVDSAPVGIQDPCDLVSVINNTGIPYTIDLSLYPTNDITFVYSSGNKVVILQLTTNTSETIGPDNRAVRVYRDNNGLWACMCS